MRRTVLLGLAVAVGIAASAGIAKPQDAAKHGITFADLIKLHRVSTPQTSADGKRVVYALTTPDMEANRNASNLWMVATDGGSDAGAIDAERARHVAGVVTGRKDDCVSFVARR